MSKELVDFVNRDNLIWCRQKAGLTISDVYSKTKWSAETQKIEKWESGESFPSISDLKKLGKIYKRAWTLFLIDRKINQLGFSVMKDFRTLTSDIPEKNGIVKRYIVSLIILISILLIAIITTFFFIRSGFNGFMIGIGIASLLGLGKTGKNTNNVRDYLEVNQRHFTENLEEITLSIMKYN